MSILLSLVLGAVIALIVLRNLLRRPQTPKLLHTPYARPGKFDVNRCDCFGQKEKPDLLLRFINQQGHGTH